MSTVTTGFFDHLEKAVETKPDPGPISTAKPGPIFSLERDNLGKTYWGFREKNITDNCILYTVRYQFCELKIAKAKFFLET